MSVKLRHALVGARAAGVLWELSPRLLVWCFESLSPVGLLNGSPSTFVVLLLTLAGEADDHAGLA